MFNPNPVEVMKKYFKDMTRIYLDIETSGLAPWEGAVIFSIAMIHEEFSWDSPNSELDEFEIVFKVSKSDWKMASPEALKVNGITWEFLQENGVPFKEGVDKLLRWLVKHRVKHDEVFVVGQNPSFDFKFLEHYMGSQLEFVGFPFKKPLDNIELAKSLKRFDPTLKMTKHNSHALSKALGVKEESKVHTAIGGARAVYRNYKALMQRMVNVEKQYRQEAIDGEGGRAVLIPFEKAYNDPDKFKIAATRAGWKQLPFDHTLFIDPNGQRWAYWRGTPSILVKI